MKRKETFALETIVYADKRVITSVLGVMDLSRYVDFVSGHDNCLHQIPRAMEQIKPFVRQQFPWLDDVPDLDGLKSSRDLARFLGEQIVRFGSSHMVEAMPPGLYDPWDPQHAEQEMARRKAKEEAQKGASQHEVPGGGVMSFNFDIEEIFRASSHLHDHE